MLQTSSIKKLQLRIVRHYYGVTASVFFLIVKPINATADDIKRWHNTLVSIADFCDQYGKVFIILAVIISTIFLLVSGLLFMFDLQYSSLSLDSIVRLFKHIFGFDKMLETGCFINNQCYPS
jgi:hypothetical protein